MRNVDEGLVRRLKIQAAIERVTMGELAERILDEGCERYDEVEDAPGGGLSEWMKKSGEGK